MNIIDRFVSFFNPVAGTERIKARAMLEASTAIHNNIVRSKEGDQVSQRMRNVLRQGYEAYSRSYNLGEFDPTLDPRSYINGNANQDVLNAIRTARRLLNDRAMNDPVFQHALNISCDGLFGDGIIPTPNSNQSDRELKVEIDNMVQEKWDDHFETTNIDIYGQDDIYGIWYKHQWIKRVEGECIIRKIWNSKTDTARKGLTHPLQLEVMSCRYLVDTLKFYEWRGKQYDATGGIVRNPDNNWVIGYLIYKNDPDLYPSSDYVFIPAQHIILDAFTPFAGMIRGWSPFASVVPDFHDLNDINSAAAKRAKIDAALNVIVEMPPFGQAGGVGTGEDSDGEFDYGTDSFAPDGEHGYGFPTTPGGSPITNIGSGQVMRVHSGSKIHNINPQPSQIYDPINRSLMRRVAMAAGETYEAMSKDYSQVSFISGRLAKGPVNRQYRRLQWQWIQRVGNQLWRDFLDGCYNMNAWGYEGYPAFDDINYKEVRWTLPIPDSADPEGEARAERLQLQMGKISHKEMIRRSGGDEKQVYKEIKESYDEAAANGLNLDHFIFSGSGGRTESTSGLIDSLNQELEDEPDDSSRKAKILDLIQVLSKKVDEEFPND